MSETVEVLPFFERAERNQGGLPAESYVAGFREAHSSGAGVEVTLPAEIVERTVLTEARLSVILSPDGRLMLDADGLSHDVLEAAGAASGIRDQTLESLVSECLSLDLLRGEDDPVGELAALRGQMVRALAQLDATIEQLKKKAR